MLDKKIIKKYNLVFEDIRKELGKVVIGQDEVINGVLRGLIANGHVLVEGIPGIAKTLIVKALAVISGCKFSRIQFTVDLLPTDIVGITTYDEKKGFYTVRGPIFSNFVIADEINRAPPKCVSGDTEVIIGNGDITSMEDLFKRYNGEKAFKQNNEEWIIPKETFFVPSLNLTNYKIELKPIKYLYKQRTKAPLQEVELMSGRTIKASQVHPFFTIKEGKIHNILSKDLKRNDCVLVPKRIKIRGYSTIGYNLDILNESNRVKEEIKRRKKLYNSIQKLKHLHTSDIIKRLNVDNESDKQLVFTYKKLKPRYLDYKLNINSFLIECKQFGQVRALIIPRTVNKELAHFIALLISESYHNKEEICIDMKNKELIFYFKELLKKLFGYDAKIYKSKNKKTRIVLSSKTLGRLLECIGYKTEANSGDKEIPSFIVKSKEKIIKEFLRMYAEAEGTVVKDSVKIVTKSKDIANKLSYLLLRFGIVCRIGKEFRIVRESKNTYYVIKIYGKFVKEFNDKIGFYGKEKQLKLELLSKKVMEKQCDLIPYMHKYIRNLRKSINISHKKFYGFTNMGAWNLENPKNRLGHSRYVLNRIYKNLNKFWDLKDLKKIIDGDFYCDFVKSNNILKQDKEYILYDFSIDKNHSFIAGFGGIIAHNTQSALLEAMQERQATIGKETYPMLDPFFVMGTQNPIESSGTYQLPHAQTDRFLFKVLISYPKLDQEQLILNTNISLRKFEEYDLKSIITTKEILKLQSLNQKIFLSKELEKYIVKLVDATRNYERYKLSLGKYIEWGASPRASIGLFIGAKADALMNGKNFVTPQNIKNVAHDVLRHRILLNYEGQAERISTDDVVKEILSKVDVP